MRVALGFIVMMAATVARAGVPLEVSVKLGGNVSTLSGTAWPVDDDGNFRSADEIDGPVRAGLVLPDGKVIDAEAAGYWICHDNDTVTSAIFVFPRRDSNEQAAGDVRQALLRWKLGVDVPVPVGDESGASAVLGKVTVFVRVDHGRGLIAFRLSKTPR